MQIVPSLFGIVAGSSSGSLGSASAANVVGGSSARLFPPTAVGARLLRRQTRRGVGRGFHQSGDLVCLVCAAISAPFPLQQLMLCHLGEFSL